MDTAPKDSPSTSALALALAAENPAKGRPSDQMPGRTTRAKARRIHKALKAAGWRLVRDVPTPKADQS